MKKRKNPYDRNRHNEKDEQEPWKQDFVPGLVQAAPPRPPLPPPRQSHVPTGDAILARLKAQPSSLDDLIGFFDLKKLPDQMALEKRLLELVRAGQTVLDRRGRLVPAASGAVGLSAVPKPVQAAAKPAPPAAKPAALKPARNERVEAPSKSSAAQASAKPAVQTQGRSNKATGLLNAPPPKVAPVPAPMAFLPKLAIDAAPPKTKSSVRVGFGAVTVMSS